MRRITGGLLLFLLTGCGGNGVKDNNQEQNNDERPLSYQSFQSEIPINQNLEEYKIALIGNSHSYGVSSILKEVVGHYSSNALVELKVLASGFTDDLINNKALIDELESGQWSHLVIQGQKYSQSGNYVYPTSATEQFIAMAKSLKIMPILFPEHPQQGDPLEGERVYELHKSIAQNQPSCVAPIGLVWNKAIAQLGSQYFYSPDGNHAAAYGFMSTSLTLAQIITGEIVDSDEQQIINSVPSDVQAELARIVSQTLAENDPCN
ncbi:hypothetical protein CWB72_05995 [Pseudoalteromonas phenolica]|uniref:hypothetical protein n=1 Tax=Pseudoalteromonas phenolica TaxID=161398 RepID=UPI00110AF5BE|nr:hypothetical protein [Pseudoalteromonas phenolica]TMN91795.1 hypothetical protein CWB72_05995 [Pseudoalteromonas phenolica]